MSQKRQQKEEAIIDAAEAVFFSGGWGQAKMEEVAKKAGMSKASLYFYFKSREELYLAISLRALQLLIDVYYKAIADNSTKSGFERVMATFEAYLAFSETHVHYHEALFTYMSMIRQPAGKATDLPDALKDSIYYQKLQDLHNLPLAIVVRHIDAGKADGSITNAAPSNMLYLTNWALIAGFIKLQVYGGKERSSLYRINLQEWKAHILKTARQLLQG
jgi:AcrR family transcriptional regulator